MISFGFIIYVPLFDASLRRFREA